MVTQQDIIDEVNRKTVDYNLSWADVRLDADRAITRINNYVGTRYPKMSDILLGPNSTYTFNSGGVETEYFEDEHIWNVVIPFIAMEVLARDEEFTTVYQKYMADVEQGLYDMFRKEFNRVPAAFRQRSDVGVFFGSDTALEKINRNSEEQLPVFKFRIHYHVNNDNIVFKSATSFVQDGLYYEYEDYATVKGWNIEVLSGDGTKAYQFRGWLRDPNQVIEEYIEPGAAIQVLSDIHLYATWDVTNVLNCTYDGVVTIKDRYKKSLTNLEIPAIVNNTMVRTISTDFLISTNEQYEDAVNLKRIVLPDYLNTIEYRAFRNFEGESILLPETVRDIQGNTYAGIRIESLAFEATPNLTTIILPTNVHTIQENAFPPVNGKTLVINCRLLSQNRPLYDAVEDAGWNNSWYTVGGTKYTVVVNWGYNG